MRYVVQLLSVDAQLKVSQYIEDKIKEQLTGNKILSREVFGTRLRSQLHYYWSDPEAYEAFDLSFKMELEIYGIKEPETIEQTYEGKEGYRQEPRIEWNGKVTRISEIPEIISYKPVVEKITG